MSIEILVYRYYKDHAKHTPICSIKQLIIQFYFDANSDNFDLDSIIDPNQSLAITNMNKCIKYVRSNELNQCHIKFANTLQKNKIYSYSFDIKYRNKPLYIGLVVNNSYEYFSDLWYATSDTGFAIDLQSGEFVTYIDCLQKLSSTPYISQKIKQKYHENDSQNKSTKIILVINRQNESVRYICNDYDEGIAYHLHSDLTYSVAVCLTTIGQIIRLNYSNKLKIDNAHLTKHDKHIIAMKCYWKKLQHQHLF